MAIQSAAGTKISISAGLPSTYNLSGFSALTYTDIGEVTEIGEIGKTYNLIEHIALSDRKPKKMKGSYKNGSLSLPVALDVKDAGQDLCKAASEDDALYSFKVVLQDGTTFFFTALVMSFVRKVGSVDTMVEATITVELEGDPVEHVPVRIQ